MNNIIEQLIQELSEYCEVFIPNQDQYKKFQHILKKLERKYLRKLKKEELSK